MNHKTMRTVLVTRPQPAADELAEKLRGRGYGALGAPMMEYVGVDAAFPDLADYQALIFTSAEGVRHFSSLADASNLPVLAVGDATAAAAARAGFTRVISAKGNGAAVAALLAEEAPKLNLKKILHPCSADTPDSIAAALEGMDVTVVRRPVYKAALTENFPDDVLAALRRGTVDTVMLFSARTAANFVNLLQKSGIENLSRHLEVIAISKAAAAPLGELHWRCVRVAKKPQLAAVVQALNALEKAGPPNRRYKPDRRVSTAHRDGTGNIVSDDYTGPDRRVIHRRTHDQRQRQRVMQEKIKFLNRSVLTFAFMFTAIVLVGVFLFDPEYAHLEHMPFSSAPQQQSAPSNAGDGTSSFFGGVGGMLSNGIGKVENLVGMGGGAGTPETDMGPAPTDYTQVLYNLSDLRKSDGAAAAQALQRLKDALAAPDVQTRADVARVVNQQRQRSSTLNGLFGSVSGKDVAAAAMLLALNEFRSDVYGGRPYASDLAVLQKFTGSDPGMNRALNRLAPYAESGVMSRTALQAELGGLMGDVIKSEMSGQSLSVQEDAKKRYERLVKAGNWAGIQGDSSAATVARAQIMIDEGHVREATQLLNTLQGPSASAVQPWMKDATNYNIANDASDNLTAGIVNDMTTVGMDSVQNVMEKIKRSLGVATVPFMSPAMTQNAHGGADVIAPESVLP